MKQLFYMAMLCMLIGSNAYSKNTGIQTDPAVTITMTEVKADDYTPAENILVVPINYGVKFSCKLAMTKSISDQVPAGKLELCIKKSDGSIAVVSTLYLSGMAWTTNSDNTTQTVDLSSYTNGFYFNGAQFDYQNGKIFFRFQMLIGLIPTWVIIGTGNEYTAQVILSNNTVCCDKLIVTSGNPGSFSGTLPKGGSGVYTYQWQSSTNNASWTDIPGANGPDYFSSPSFIITNHIYYRRVVTSGAVGSNISNVATVLVYKLTTATSLGLTQYCSGASFLLSYTTNLSANAGNVFTAQISDATGSFASPIAIGSLSSTGSGVIACSLPGVPAGTGYRVRVVGSNPVIIGTTTTPFTVLPTEINVSMGNQLKFCPGGQITIPFSTCGYYAPNNQFTAQLSNEFGNFTTFYNLGSVASRASGAISGNLPTSLPESSNYRVRVVSSNPSITGFSNTQNITIRDFINNKVGGFCKGAIGAVVPFVSCSQKNAGNVFTAQLSNINGDFSNPINLGTLVGTTSGNIPITLPNSLAIEGDYKLRVCSSDPFGISDVTICPITNCGLTFDGVNDVVTANPSGINEFPGGSLRYLTVEAWINLPSTPQALAPIITAKPSAPNGFLFGVSNNGTALTVYSDSKVYVSNTIPNLYDNNCHHIAATFNGFSNPQVLKFFLDGVLIGSRNVVPGIDLGQPILRIGYDIASNTGMKGKINDIKIWNVTKTDAEIAANRFTDYTNLTPNLYVYFKFQEVAGQTVIDGSSFARHGRLGNATTVETSDPVRSYTSCFSTDKKADVEFEEIPTDELLNEQEVLVYPNPFSEDINVVLLDLAKEGTCTIKISDIYGNVLIEKVVYQNDVYKLGASLPSGLYLLHLQKADKSVVKRIVKIQ